MSMSRYANSIPGIMVEGGIGRLTSPRGAPAGAPTSVSVDENGGCGNLVNVEPCSTTWFQSRGDTRPQAPGNAPCGDELSAHVLKGRRKMPSIVVSCPFQILGNDVPIDDLGVLDTFRNVCVGAQALGQGANTVLQAAMAATVTFDFSNLGLLTTAIGPSIAVGIWVKLAFNIAQTNATTLNITTGGTATKPFTTPIGSPVSRNVTIELLDSCPTVEIFVPFSRQQNNGSVGFPIVSPFAPVSVIVGQLTEATAGSSTVIVTGLPAGVGSVSCQLVGPNSQLLPGVFGALNNAQSSLV